MLLAGILVGKSVAMPTVGDMAKNHSVVEKAACGGWGVIAGPDGTGCAAAVIAGALSANIRIMF
jgi:hypothetical protein